MQSAIKDPKYSIVDKVQAINIRRNLLVGGDGGDTINGGSGADIVFLNGLKCTSPCTLELKRGSDTRIDIKKPGYEPVYVLVQSRLAGSTFGNILAGGIIGGVVDGGNGASNTLFPRPLKVRLAPEGSGTPAMLLDKDGKELMTVEEHNTKVRLDVAKTIGAELAGVEAPAS